MARGVHGLKFIATIWGIWKWRNNVVFEAPGWQVEEAWRRICYEHDEILFYGSPMGPENDDDRLLQKWCCPPSGKFKLNVDGSFLPDSGHMGGGGIIRDSKGSWLAGFLSHKTGGNVLAAEALALKEGLKLAWDKGCRALLCEVDSKDLLQALADSESVRFMPVLRDIHEWLRRQWEVNITWIPRECNKVADWLAHEGAIQVSPGVCYLDSPHLEVQNLMMRDLFRSS